MSMWVHVGAVIRIDSFCYIPDEQLTAIFGKQCLWSDPSDEKAEMRKHPEQYLPRGGDGTLRMTVWHNPDEHDARSTTVSIFGDLRGTCDTEPLVKWFKEKCMLCAEQYKIRQAVITIDPEFLEPVTYRYDGPERIHEKDDDDECLLSCFLSIQ